ncbi:hypothetical protein ASF69_10850 [Rhizobium sp. Leaf311]|nr:hypothetical protein ASF69_10850 [Rhizobium sp. Leaf311]
MCNDTMSFTAQNSTTVHSGGELHLTCAKANVLMREDDMVAINGSNCFLISMRLKSMEISAS